MLVRKCQVLETRDRSTRLVRRELFKAALSVGVKRAEEMFGLTEVKLEITPTAKFLTVQAQRRCPYSP